MPRLALLAFPLAVTAAAIAPPTRAPAPPVDKRVMQVLNRLTFGPRPGDAERVAAMGVEKWIDLQLHPERIDDRAAEAFVAAHYPTLAMDAATLYAKYPPPQVLRAQVRRVGRDGGMAPADSVRLREAARQSQRVVADVMSAKVARAVMSERQLNEVLVDFWENHFSVFAGKGQVRYVLGQYQREAIRPHAMGKFRDLLGAVAKSPAMLFYLDNAQSVADSMHPTLAGPGARAAARRPGAPRPGAVRRRPPGADTAMMQQLAQRQRSRGLNENYARELMELHTLGVDGGYTQQDIVEVARALTGWSVQPPQLGGPKFVFRPAAHDAAEKRVLGHTLRAGRGLEDGEEVLDVLARHPSTAKYIATKLARRFVSDTPPAALVERAAAAFRRTDGDIRETVRAIVTSPEFFAPRAYRSKVKSPLEVVVSAARALNAEPDSTPRTAQIVARLGQPIFGHQAPNGWPETGEAWMNTGAILNRINFGMAAAAGRLPGVRPARLTALAPLRTRPRGEQVDGVVAALLGGEASPETRGVLVSGENPLLRTVKDTVDVTDVSGDSLVMGDQAMTRRQMRRADAPFRPRQPAGRAGFANLPNLTGLPQIIGLALGSPEFQRR